MAKFSGGTSVNHDGYLKITAGPHRDKLVHIMIAEAMLGRKLHRDETIDHLDADKKNCEWTNLRVLSRKDHGAASNRQKWFLKNRAEFERKQWEEWIAAGGDRPDGVVENNEILDLELDISFNPEEMSAD